MILLSIFLPRVSILSVYPRSAIRVRLIDHLHIESWDQFASHFRHPSATNGLSQFLIRICIVSDSHLVFVSVRLSFFIFTSTTKCPILTIILYCDGRIAECRVNFLSVCYFISRWDAKCVVRRCG